MKKSIIALAVAGALTAPMVAQADATLYGSLRMKINDMNANGELDVADNVSRIGIKGSTELFSGNKAIYQFEQGIDTADGGAWGAGRLASIGITGDFGTAMMGRMWSAHALWTILPHHIGENTGMNYSAGYINAATPSDSDRLHRVGNALTYISPNMEGFQVAASILADSNADGEDLDAYNLAAKFSVGDFTVAASHIGVETAANADTTALSVSYKADALYLGARYMQNDANGANDDQYSATAAYTMENTTLIAGYANDDSWVEEDSYNFEVQQKLGKQARAYVAYVQQGLAGYDGFEAGYRVDF